MRSNCQIYQVIYSLFFYHNSLIHLFCSTFTADESIYCMRTQKTLQLLFKPEDDFWMIMVNWFVFFWIYARNIFWSVNNMDSFFRLSMHLQNGRHEIVPSTRNIDVKMLMKSYTVKFLSNPIICFIYSMEHSLIISLVRVKRSKSIILLRNWPSFFQRYLRSHKLIRTTYIKLNSFSFLLCVSF